MKTLFLNPPSFEKFDGGAGSRWPATREIESYWYPVWLVVSRWHAARQPSARWPPAPHHSGARLSDIAKDYEFVVLFTSTVGFHSDLRMARAMKEQKPDIKICFVGPHVQIKPAESLLASSDLDFVVRGEFDHAVVEYAQGKPLSEIAQRQLHEGRQSHSQSVAPADANRRARRAAVCDRRLPEEFDDRELQRAVPAASLRFVLHGARMSGACARSACGRKRFRATPGACGRSRIVAREFKQAHKMFPQAKEFFFDDDTFNIRKDRVLALCKEFKPVGFQWSCTARVHSDYETLKAMADAGCRLLIVGFESGDPQILKNIKKGATLEMGRNFVKNCKKVGIRVHGDFIIGLPGETKETIEKTIELRQGTRLRNDSGFHGPRLSRHRAVRSGNARRIPARAKPSPMTAATSFRTSNIRDFRTNTWSSP